MEPETYTTTHVKPFSLDDDSSIEEESKGCTDTKGGEEKSKNKEHTKGKQGGNPT